MKPSSNGVPRVMTLSPPASLPAVPENIDDDFVIIVDDHESLRASLARALRIEGIRSETYGSAEAFLSDASQRTPRCLILDMQLPGMSGHELAHVLQAERPPLPPTIFITGHDDLLSGLNGCCAVHGRLRKPFEIDELLEMLAPLRRS